MVVSLTKGGNVNLSKEVPGLSKIAVGLGWPKRGTEGAPFDLDASLFIVGADGKVLSDGHFVFYNNAVSPDGAIKHSGDNKTGDGDGDDETLAVDLTAVEAGAQRLIFAVTIHEATERGQNFGQVGTASIRVVNSADDKEIARYDLSEDFSTETAMIFGEVYRNNGEWKFKAVGAGYSGGLKALGEAHGVNIG